MIYKIVFIMFPSEFDCINDQSFLFIINRFVHIKSSYQSKKTIKLTIFMKIIFKIIISLDHVLNGPQDIAKQKDKKQEKNNE